MGKDADSKEPKILVFDIELFPIWARIWSPWDQNVSLNQVIKDWTVASYAAKWVGKKEIFYEDTRKRRDCRDDKKILKGIWKLINEADVLITQNGKSFDIKKLNARFVMNGMDPPHEPLHVDTKILAKRRFGFTYNSLEYLAIALKTEFKKLKSKKFIGQDLWTECEAGNIKAWAEMELYNKRDVLATEAVYEKLAKWGTPGVNLNVFREGTVFRCQCGSSKFNSDGTRTNSGGRYRRYRCVGCGRCSSDSGQARNLLDKEKRDSLRGRK